MKGEEIRTLRDLQAQSLLSVHYNAWPPWQKL